MIYDKFSDRIDKSNLAAIRSYLVNINNSVTFLLDKLNTLDKELLDEHIENIEWLAGQLKEYSLNKFAYYKDRVKMVKLINNEGEILDKEGYSVEGAGIFDLEGEEYIAGYTEDGEMHASVVDVDDTVLNLDGERTQYKL